MDRGVRVALSLEWRPVWLISLANPTGAVFLQGTHCNSESPVEACCSPFSVSGEKGANYSPKCTLQNPHTLSWCGIQPDHHGLQEGLQGPNMTGRWGTRQRTAVQRGRKEKYRKTGHCQLLSEWSWASSALFQVCFLVHITVNNKAYFIAAIFFSLLFLKYFLRFH